MRQSIKGPVAAAQREDAKMRASLAGGRSTKALLSPTGQGIKGATQDSFVNFMQRMGMTADNPMSTSSYGFNPISRNRVMLEWIHRGSWLGGVAVDIVANDMTRAGVNFKTELRPDDQERIDHCITRFGVWNSINETIKWGRLYGGCLGVLLIDGQDPRTPLRLESIGKGQFRGALALDRWMVEPTLEDLVTEYGPHLGLPKYYRVQQNAPALRGQAIHHSRVAIRHEGIKLPYNQRMTENLWGVSVLERLYDRMVAFDSASTGAAQLVYKSFLRTLKIKGLREIIAGNEKAMVGVMQQVEMMRRFQSIEGITLLDGEDEFDVQGHSAFSGLSDALTQFGQQLSGALQIPLCRLFGQSPAGFSTGDTDMQMYYDSIKQEQVATCHHGAHMIYQAAAASEGIKLPDNFALEFASLWDTDDSEKATIAKTNSEAVGSAYDSGLIGRQTALRELRESSRRTGIFTNITEEMIEAADDEVQPPMAEGMLPPGAGGLGEEGVGNEAGPQEETKPVGAGEGRRVKIQQPAPGGGEGDR
jgi:phage-related protein (TIGR01555 family)